jgi:hypothetical protein
MLGGMAKPTIRAVCWLRALPERRKALLGIGGILGIASMIGAIGTIRALPTLRKDRSEKRERGWLRRKLSRESKE